MLSRHRTHYWVSVWVGPSCRWDYHKQVWVVRPFSDNPVELHSVDMKDSHKFIPEYIGSSNACDVRGLDKAWRMANRLLRVLPAGSEVIVQSKYEQYVLSN